MDPLSAPGVVADTEALLNLRHLVRNIPERRLAPTGLPGGFVSRRRGRGLEAIDIRVFSEGDDIRHIDRNTTARTGIPHVRTLLLADFRPSMLWGTRRALRSVAAAEVLSLAGWRVVDAGGRVGLIAFGAGEPVYVSPRGRERGMIDVVGGLAAAHRGALEAAAAMQDTRDRPLDDALELAAGLTPGGASLFLATGLDSPGEGFDSIATALNHRASLTVLLITDSFENDPPPGSYPFMTAAGRLRWARFGGERGAARRPADPRLGQLARLDLATIVVDAGHDPERMAEDLDLFDGGRP
jgi:uncharacterized protein (DUF58 family)